MRTKEIIKVLTSIRDGIPAEDLIMYDLVLEQIKDDEKMNAYVLAGTLILIGGLVLGWYIFGYLPLTRI